ncbi:MAG: autotransporter domain-containing protein [Verrucomicrobia bacterium]|nr:autotransporter domain-containing protein [Verrucomicrobiota bacterium]
MRTLTRSLLLAAATSPLFAANFGTPFLDNTAPTISTTVSLGGQNFVNQGLVGVGVFATNVIDGRGDTFGSFSSFKVDHNTWRKNANGSYSGTLYTLPDRGYNVAGLIAYPARIHEMALSFTPDYTANTVSQTQLTLSLQRTITITDFAGQITTAVDPTGATTLQGFSNVATAGGKFAIDGEGLAIRADGSFYVSDEYGATVYHVSKTGQMLGMITPPQALLPQFSVPTTGYPTASAGVQTGGRRDNQGMEAVDLTPDGRYLMTLLQSATRQDNPADTNQGRLFTRLSVYDVSNNPTPASPVGHYLVELPTFDRDGTGGSADRTAAQSEIVALSPTSFLVLSRDGNGNGSGDNNRPLVFKTVSFVTLAGATNLAGTSYATGYTPAANGISGALGGITAAQVTPFVNLLNPTQLARFGLDMNVGAEGSANPVSVNSVGEKWEALSIVPVLDPAAPNDYFLLVGNDNDFLGTSVTMLGGAPVDATAGPAVADNPNRVLVYRVTLPGYIDPGLVISAVNRAPVMSSTSLRSVQNMGTSFGSVLKSRLSNSMRLAAPAVAADFDWQAAEQASDLCASGLPMTHGVKGGLRWWFDGSIRNISEDAGALTPSLDTRNSVGVLGLEWELGQGFYFGLGLGMQDGKSEGSDGSNIGYTGRSLTTYLLGRGDVFFGSFTLTAGRQDFDSIQSAGPYGTTPFGSTEGRSVSGELVIGATAAEFGGWSVIPLVSLSRSNARVDGYVEAGVGGVTYPTQRISSNMASASVELAKAFEMTDGSYTPFVRVGYDHDFGGEDQTSNVSVLTNGGVVDVAMKLPNADRDYATGMLGVRWMVGDFNAQAAFEYRSGDNGHSEGRFNLSLSSSF